MRKLSTAAAVAAAENVLKKRRKFVKKTLFTYNIKKIKKILLESKFLIP
jgi:hypothetical protein